MVLHSIQSEGLSRANDNKESVKVDEANIYPKKVIADLSRESC